VITWTMQLFRQPPRATSNSSTSFGGGGRSESSSSTLRRSSSLGFVKGVMARIRNDSSISIRARSIRRSLSEATARKKTPSSKRGVSDTARIAQTLSVGGNDNEPEIIKMLGDDRVANIVRNVAKKYAEKVDNTILTQADFNGFLGVELCGQRIPRISLVAYLSRLVQSLNQIYEEEEDENGDVFASAGFQCLLIGTIYIDRLLESRPDFKIHGFNIHRLFFVATWMAVKFVEDETPEANLSAKIGGMDMIQMKHINIGFCKLMDFNFGLDLQTSLQSVFDQVCLPLGIDYKVSVPTWDKFS
jgi:hypothetical protein